MESASHNYPIHRSWMSVFLWFYPIETITNVHIENVKIADEGKADLETFLR